MLNKTIFFLLGFILLFGSWELACYFLPHFQFILPAPSAIFTALTTWYPRFLFHSFVTLKEMAGGFLLATTVAFPLAWVMHRFYGARTLLQPLFIVIQCLPMFALAPIMVTWFGWGFTAIVIPTALMIFFPLTLNIYQGLRATPKELLNFFAINGASRRQTFFKLQLPWAIPYIFAGFRISSAIAGIGAIAGEWAGAQNGLGILMLESRRNLDLEITFGALACLTIMSTSLYGVILFFEKLCTAPRKMLLPFKKVLLKPLPHPRFAFSFFFFIGLPARLPKGLQRNNEALIRLDAQSKPYPALCSCRPRIFSGGRHRS